MMKSKQEHIPLKSNRIPCHYKQREAPPHTHIWRLLRLGILILIQFTWNTLLLPLKKLHTNDYHLVYECREVNKRVMDIYPTVPNSYTLLSTLLPNFQWYIVLDLKGAFFSLRLAPKSQAYFAFVWHYPEIRISGQLTWTHLPQRFKNSPILMRHFMKTWENIGCRNKRWVCSNMWITCCLLWRMEKVAWEGLSISCTPLEK